MSEPFVESFDCECRAHCLTCRDVEVGRAWRQQLTAGFTLPGNRVDFPCPHGVAWTPGTGKPGRRKADRPVPPVGWKQAARRVSHGLLGLAKSLLGIDPAPETVIRARLEVCGACDQNVKCIGATEVRCCGRLLDVLDPTAVDRCGCVITQKVKVAGEKCPLGKW